MIGGNGGGGTRGSGGGGGAAAGAISEVHRNHLTVDEDSENTNEQLVCHWHSKQAVPRRRRNTARPPLINDTNTITNIATAATD